MTQQQHGKWVEKENNLKRVPHMVVKWKWSEFCCFIFFFFFVLFWKCFCKVSVNINRNSMKNLSWAMWIVSHLFGLTGSTLNLVNWKSICLPFKPRIKWSEMIWIWIIIYFLVLARVRCINVSIDFHFPCRLNGEWPKSVKLNCVWEWIDLKPFTKWMCC